MTCQEVMIDMQRQLDDDLDSFESEALSAHLAHCSDCRAMFERLQSLSAELENLPKVTPRYSLVDAILPQLEQIDLRETGERAAGSAPVPDPLDGMRQGRRRRLRDRFSLRALSGVIAAGVVVGLFLVTYDPQSAGDMNDAGTAMESEAADNGANMMMMEMAATNDAAPGDSSAPRKMDANAAADSKAEPEAGGAVREAPAGDSDKDDLVPMMNNATDHYQAEGAMSSEPAPASPPLSGGNDGKLQDAAPAAPQSNGAAPGAGIAAPSDDSTESISSMHVEPTASGGAAEDAALPPEIGDNNKMGIAAAVPDAPAAAVSPDGAYRAVAADARVTVFDAKTGEELFKSRELAGEIRLAAWSADSKTFEYEVVAPEGASERFRIDVQAGTEAKQD